MKTFIPKVAPSERKWFVLDLEGQVLGRAAVKVANVLRGKDKPIFTRHLDAGENVVVINAEKVRVTGKSKMRQMAYYRYSGYPGGLRKTTLEEMLQKHPERVFENAVKKMMPKTRLGRKMIKKLHIYRGADHPHGAQKPETLTVD
jgi:large subunit ribosomal protein L13